MFGRFVRSQRLSALALLFGAIAIVTVSAGWLGSVANAAIVGTYTNPLPVVAPGVGNGLVESCADPSVIRGAEGEMVDGKGIWYMYCTADPLNSADKDVNNNFNFRLIPMFTSTDLVNWTYVGDAFTARPAYATADAGIWAPEIEYYAETGQYHLYYTVTATTVGGSAIGVATSDSATGPWTHSANPVIEPHAPDCCADQRRWVFDPEVLRTPGADYIYYGSYSGGVSVRQLAEDGLTSDPNTQTNVGIANKYEGAEVIFRDGYYYLFVSATDCCRGPLTGYSVYTGRSASPTGPFLDRNGRDLNDNEDNADPTDARAGGTPALSMNGNRWVGPGHNTVFQDLSGQWWTIYHAINRLDPYFAGGVNIFDGNCGPEGPVPAGTKCGDLNKRPALLDPLDFVDGWPTVRGGLWASDTPQPAPVAQSDQTAAYQMVQPAPDVPGALIPELSDEFNGVALDSNRWSWVRPPGAGTSVSGGAFNFDTQDADLFVTNNSASVLTEATPAGDYVVETRVRLTVPEEGCCFNYRQAALLIYGDDDNFVKITQTSIWNTRQTEFAKELAPVPPGYPRHGNTVVGPPSEWTHLRIVKRVVGAEEFYTPYTAFEYPDGSVSSYVRGGTWTHNLGAGAKIGLVSMGGPDFRAQFDYVRVYALQQPTPTPTLTSTSTMTPTLTATTTTTPTLTATMTTTPTLVATMTTTPTLVATMTATGTTAATTTATGTTAATTTATKPNVTVYLPIVIQP